MAAITKDDLKTHIYPEITEIITRADDTIVTAAIAAGEGEVKSYLNRFDTATMFGGSYANEYFKNIVKDVVCWHLIKLANPNINLELFRTAYEDAKKNLKEILKGETSPDFPLKPNDPATDIDEAGTIEYGSNPKRNNHY